MVAGFHVTYIYYLIYLSSKVHLQCTFIAFGAIKQSKCYIKIKVQ